jgi:hypothetical protein
MLRNTLAFLRWEAGKWPYPSHYENLLHKYRSGLSSVFRPLAAYINECVSARNILQTYFSGAATNGRDCCQNPP